MKGYIYTMYRGADPGFGWGMTDPIFGKVPTLGACMPNIRRLVVPGDWIFTISGRVDGVQQYCVGGFQVREKIHALEAFQRFPEKRLKMRQDGTVSGNIIVNSKGEHHKLDDHDNFASRVENYIVGKNPLELRTTQQIEDGRAETMDVLQDVFDADGSQPSDILGRWRRVDADQIEILSGWLRDIRGR